MDKAILVLAIFDACAFLLTALLSMFPAPQDEDDPEYE